MIYEKEDALFIATETRIMKMARFMSLPMAFPIK